MSNVTCSTRESIMYGSRPACHGGSRLHSDPTYRTEWAEKIAW
jgi:hypothetical protein